MKILKKRGVVEKRGEEETKSKPHAPVDTLGTRLACNLRVGFDIKEGVNYTDFTSCLFVCLDVCICYQGLRFLCYVSSVMFPVGLIICD